MEGLRSRQSRMQGLAPDSCYPARLVSADAPARLWQRAGVGMNARFQVTQGRLDSGCETVRRQRAGGVGYRRAYQELWQYAGVWEVVTQHSDGQRCSGGSRHLIRVQCLVERPDRWPERTGVAWREVGCREDSQRGSRVRCMPLVLIDPSLLERCSTNEVSQDLGLRRHPPWRRAEKASLPGSETGAGRGISRQVWSFGCPALAMVTVVLASRWAKQRASGEALSSWVVALGAWAGVGTWQAGRQAE